jgi:hypothetical protein
MSEKIIHHLSTIVEEFKQLLTDEISNSFQSILDQNNASINKTESYLTIDELALSFKISKSHINNLRKKYKNFPALLIDGSLRFKHSQVEEFFINISKSPP